MTTFYRSTSILAFSLIGAFALSPAWAGNDSRRQADTPLPSENEPAPAPNAASRHAQSARVLMGQDVRDNAGDTLGELEDLAIDPQQGKILFALVASGGLLGVGEEIRAVPFAALSHAADDSRDLVLGIARERWSQAPALAPDHATALSDANIAKDVVAFYQDALSRDFATGNDDARARMVLASDVIGNEVVNESHQVGTVQDIIVHFESRRASVLLDVDDDFAGTDREFLVNFAQLTPASKDQMTTTLSPDDFAQAGPSDDRWWTLADGAPYWWSGYGGFGGAAHLASTTDFRTQAAIAAGETEGRPSVDTIRGRLRSDSALSERARLATVEQDGNRLILEGLVDSHAARNEVGRLVSEIADGWEIVNRLEVRTAAE